MGLGRGPNDAAGYIKQDVRYIWASVHGFTETLKSFTHSVDKK